jgi:hypothetical protein
MVVRRRSSLDGESEFYSFFGVHTPFDPEDTFVTARFLSPSIFGFIRLLFAIYGVCVVVVDIVLTGIFTLVYNQVLICHSKGWKYRHLFLVFYRYHIYRLDILFHFRSGPYVVVHSNRSISTQ